MKLKDPNVCIRLGEERKRLSLNQNKVATFCEVSVKTVGRWERNTPIPADKLSLLAKIGYDVSYILTGIKLAPQIAGLEAAANVWKTSKDETAHQSEPGNKISNQQIASLEAISNIWKTNEDKTTSQSDMSISKEQENWLNLLESLTGGDSKRLKQIGLALVGYSYAKTNK